MNVGDFDSVYIVRKLGGRTEVTSGRSLNIQAQGWGNAAHTRPSGWCNLKAFCNYREEACWNISIVLDTHAGREHDHVGFAFGRDSAS